MNKLILASSSPRREQLFNLLNIPFTIHTEDVDETYPEGQNPDEIVQFLAQKKAEATAAKFPTDYVVGADTIVVFQDKVLGKPNDEQEALQMLSMLSGNTHQVYTGVAIIYANACETFFEKTDVTLWNLTQREIDEYLQTGESFDKAGAYGIQGYGATLVEKIAGDYYTVVGLPIARLAKKLKEMIN